MIKSWRESKTIWFNILSTVIAILSMPEFAALVPAEQAPYLALFVALGNMNLRSMTAGGLTT